MTQRKRAESVSKVIDRMVRRIVRKFHPDKIILFGSQARGNATEDSDVDLLVIMPVRREEKQDVEIAIAGVLHDIFVSKDILVASPEEFQRRRDIVGTVPYAANAEGKVLYARPI